ncbi:MAG TPA: 4'-phosphopantetheinyl transferase superfamily protein [Pyrinomonadaceae bacterium]
MPTPDTWSPPPADLTLAHDEVHVWRASLEQPAHVLAQLRATLAADEHERAARFHFERDRAHFIVGRGVLRAILGRYLPGRAEQLQFQYGAYGKPALTAEFARGSLSFNLAHSHALALFAVTRGRAVGVDVEYLRAELAGTQIAERFFSAREVAALCALPAEQQPRAFFDCWTRKEAYIKARGEGLSFPLAAFDVSLGPDEPAALLCVRGDAQESARWSLRALDAALGYAAALVVEGHDWQLKTWQWQAS